MCDKQQLIIRYEHELIIQYLFELKKKWTSKEDVINHVKQRTNDTDIEIYFDELVEHLWIQSYEDLMTGEIDGYSLTRKGIEKSLEKSIISMGNIFNKITDVSISNTNEIIEYKEFIEKHTNKAIASAEELKTKIVELMGVFISIFTLISSNIGVLSLVSKEETLKGKITIVLIVNGTLLCSILLILFGIKAIIFNEDIDTKKKYLLFLLPVIILLIGIILG